MLAIFAHRLTGKRRAKQIPLSQDPKEGQSVQSWSMIVIVSDPQGVARHEGLESVQRVSQFWRYIGKLSWS